MLGSPLKTHGGKGAFKGKMANWIVSLMPPRKSDGHPDGYLHYVEPFFGGGSVLLANDPEGISEVANDLDRNLANFWSVLQSEELFAAFQRSVEAVPFSEHEYSVAKTKVDWLESIRDKDLRMAMQVEWAVSFFVMARQSLSGRQDDFATLSKTRVRRGMNEQASAWLSAVEGLPAIHDRMKRVVVLNRDAKSVIEQQDGPQTLFYIDAPYVKSTRTAPSVYRHEMTDAQHVDLIDVLSRIEGRAIVSMYRHPIYDALKEKHGWQRHDFSIVNNASMSKKKQTKTECCWTNY